MSTPNLEDLPHYTYDDYVQWESRWELIYGVAHAISPTASITHQFISQHIASQLERALENCVECHALLPVYWKIDEETTHCQARQFGGLRGTGKSRLSE